MATLFTLLKKQTSGMATVYARVQCSHPKVNPVVGSGGAARGVGVCCAGRREYLRGHRTAGVLFGAGGKG